MASVLRAYNAVLQRRPMISQCLTSAALFGASDVVAQQLVEKKGLKNHDFNRTLRSTFYGGAMFGPLVVKWYGLLARMQFSSPRKALAYRVYLDQALFAPGIIAFYFTSMTLLEGNPISKAMDRLEKAYTPTLFRNWLVFIPTQLVNFSLVPPHMRVLVVGVVSLFWNTYLSLANAQSQGASAAIVDVEKGEAPLDSKTENAVL